MDGRGGWLGRERRGLTSNGMVSFVFRADATVAVTIEAGHGVLREEGEGLFEDCGGSDIRLKVRTLKPRKRKVLQSWLWFSREA